MAITEDHRYRLFQHLVEVLGRENASTLMEPLPPAGWADVATKQDLEHLRARLQHEFDQRDLRFERIDLRFNQVDARFDQIDARFDQIDARFDLVDARFDQINARFEQVDARFDSFRLEMKADMERAFRMQTFAPVGLMFTMLSAFLALQQSLNR